MANITVEEFNEFIEQELTWMYRIGIRAEEIGQDQRIVWLEVFYELLRPGDKAAGLFLMALKDVTMYAVVISKFGNAKMAVTTSMNIKIFGASWSWEIVGVWSSLKRR